MSIEIRKLTVEDIDDYFDFFSNRAFSDDSPEGPCCCIGWQMTQEQVDTEFSQVEAYGGGPDGFMKILRKIVKEQIESGALQGYLAYVDGVLNGWCNANDKAHFPVQSSNGARLHAPAELREKVVVCFEVAPACRGRGIATALLQRVVDDAKEENFLAVEGFPQKRGERYEWDYNGPVRLYEKVGFVKVAEREDSVVMRKELM